MKIINFSCTLSNDEFGRPVPSKSMIPSWYKQAETYYYKKDCINKDCDCNPTKNAGLKTCMPVLDAFTSGYYLLTPFDIYIGKKDDGSLDITWNGPEEWGNFIGERPVESGATIPRPAGHHPNHLIWSNPWGWKTPKGYSTIVTHPLNRFDLPFTTMSGIMDSDKIQLNGNVPFFVKEGFYGLIPEGTPFIHLIPVKRNRWGMLIKKHDKYKYESNGFKVRSEEAFYKKKIWERKEFS
jgi:hypothetical protein